jgi:Flp pilus assembly protein TadD
MLAAIEHRLATEALQAGAEEEATRHLRAALAALKELLRYQPDARVAARAAAALYARLGDDDAVAAYRALLEREGESSHLHEILALLAHEAGDREGAVRHARRALELAPPALRARAEATLRLVAGDPGEGAVPPPQGAASR